VVARSNFEVLVTTSYSNFNSIGLDSWAFSNSKLHSPLRGHLGLQQIRLRERKYLAWLTSILITW
jgi:hypothetical protein